jgi:TrmH family RNA methyltransferase
MISKNEISFIKSLQQKKIRQENKLFVAEGEKLLNELLSSSLKIKKIYSTNDPSEFQQLRNNYNAAEAIFISENDLKRISSLTTPNKVLVVAEIPDYEIDLTEISNSLSLLLDEINDPGNLGTMIRIADWFGIKHVICSEETVDCYNPKVVQATMGSLFRVKVVYADLEQFLNSMKRFSLNVYGGDAKGENIYSAVLAENGIIMMGSESHGIQSSLKKYITSRLAVPQFSSRSDKPESLNVAVAAAVICSEFRRRQNKKV